MNKPRVFIETSTIKLATYSRTVLNYEDAVLEIDGVSKSFVVSKVIDINPLDKIQDEKFRAEVDLLAQISNMAKTGEIELISNIEVWDELSEITLFGRQNNLLLEASVQMVDLPIRYSRPCGSEAMVDFLMTLTDSRFLELRRACGANQGETVQKNQLIDAFHMWCAEEANATDFLTCDLKLKRILNNDRHFESRLSIVCPSELVEKYGGVN